MRSASWPRCRQKKRSRWWERRASDPGRRPRRPAPARKRGPMPAAPGSEPGCRSTGCSWSRSQVRGKCSSRSILRCCVVWLRRLPAASPGPAGATWGRQPPRGTGTDTLQHRPYYVRHHGALFMCLSLYNPSGPGQDQRAYPVSLEPSLRAKRGNPVGARYAAAGTRPPRRGAPRDDQLSTREGQGQRAAQPLPELCCDGGAGTPRGRPAEAGRPLLLDPSEDH